MRVDSSSFGGLGLARREREEKGGGVWGVRLNYRCDSHFPIYCKACMIERADVIRLDP